MAVDERRRIELFEQFAASVGEEAATTLFALLPLPGRDVATSADIAELRRDMDARFEQVDRRFEQVDARLDQVDARFDQVDARFDQVDARFGHMEQRFEERFTQLEDRLGGAFERRINDAITTQTRTIIFGLLGALVVIGGYALSLARLAG